MNMKTKMTRNLLAGVALGATVALSPITAFSGPVYSRGEQEEYDLNDFEPGSGGGGSNYYDMGTDGGFPTFGQSGGTGGGGGGGGTGGGGGGGGGSGTVAFTSRFGGGGGGGGTGGGDTTFWDPCWIGNCGGNTGGEGGTNGNTGGNGDSVPEPFTLGLLGVGLVGLGLARRRRKQG